MHKIHEQMQRFRVHLILLLAVILWSSAFVGVRAVIDDFTPTSLTLLRFIVASVCMFFIFRQSRITAKLTYWDIAIIIICGFVGIAGFNIAANYGMKTVDAAISSFVVSQVPIAVILLSAIFLKEKLTVYKIIGSIISIIGITVILLSNIKDYSVDIGLIYLLVGVLAISTYIMLQKPILKKISGIHFVSMAIWSGTLIMMIYIGDLITEIQTAPTSSILIAIYLGIFSTALAYTLWSYGLSQIKASSVVSYLYLMPIITMLLGIIFLGEYPAWLAVTGGVIALLGVIISERGKV